jgi:hypothetical protein
MSNDMIVVNMSEIKSDLCDCNDEQLLEIVSFIENTLNHRVSMRSANDRDDLVAENRKLSLRKSHLLHLLLHLDMDDTFGSMIEEAKIQGELLKIQSRMKQIHTEFDALNDLDRKYNFNL